MRLLFHHIFQEISRHKHTGLKMRLTFHHIFRRLLFFRNQGGQIQKRFFLFGLAFLCLSVFAGFPRSGFSSEAPKGGKAFLPEAPRKEAVLSEELRRARSAVWSLELRSKVDSQPLFKEGGAILNVEIWDTASGTGFFISPKRMVTNFHVLSGLLEKGESGDITLSQGGERDFSQSDLTFEALREAQTSENSSLQISIISRADMCSPEFSARNSPSNLVIKKILRISKSLDLALLEVEGEAPFYLNLSEKNAPPDEDLFFFWHSGKKLLYSRKTGSSKVISGHPIFHTNHYIPSGSSGSPVLDASGRLSGVVFMANSNLIYAIGVPQLKDFIEGKEGSSCESISYSKCLAAEARAIRRAAEAGKAKSQFNLGLMYEQGFGVEKNYAFAQKWFRAATKQGYILAQTHVDYLSAADEFSIMYQPAAKLGYSPAQNSLGLMYLEGRGVERDVEAAAYWFREAAEQGFSSAQINLGAMHYDGEGMEKNIEKAVYWFRRASDQGNPIARHNLALMSYYGQEGVEKNFSEAAYWFRKAANQADRESEYRLALMCYEGRGVEQNFPAAAYWFRRAADRGDAQAQHQLALMHYEGRGAEKSSEIAAYWLTQSAKQGYEPALRLLKNAGKLSSKDIEDSRRGAHTPAITYTVIAHPVGAEEESHSGPPSASEGGYSAYTPSASEDDSDIPADSGGGKSAPQENFEGKRQGKENQKNKQDLWDAPEKDRYGRPMRYPDNMTNQQKWNMYHKRNEEEEMERNSRGR